MAFILVSQLLNVSPVRKVVNHVAKIILANVLTAKKENLLIQAIPTHVNLAKIRIVMIAIYQQVYVSQVVVKQDLNSTKKKVLVSYALKFILAYLVQATIPKLVMNVKKVNFVI